MSKLLVCLFVDRCVICRKIVNNNDVEELQTGRVGGGKWNENKSR